MTIPARAFRLDLTVRPDDIDPQNHASNVAIVGYMNAAAWRHSVALGFGNAEYRSLAGLWVVKRHEIDYHAQAMLGDELICHTWPSGLAKASAERRHRIVRKSDGAVIAEGLNTWAWIDANTHRPARIPPILREAFNPANFL
jgi:acyl-CoA thioester hydrolase